MKEAIIVKRIDLWLQLLALIIPFIWAIAAADIFIVFVAYISVGSVQVLSCLLNKLGWQSNLKHHGRRLYERLLLVVLVVESIALLVVLLSDNYTIENAAKYVFGALPFFSPIMAIWYMVITREELAFARRLNHRRVI